MKRKWLLGLAALCLSVFATVGLVGCGESDGGGGTNTEQGGGEETPVNYTVTYDANGGVFSNGATSITDTAEKNGKLTAPESPTRKNHSFSGWVENRLTSDNWDFATDTVTENITLYATWKQQSGIILSVDGASMEEKEIFMLVDTTVESVSLANKLVCSDNSTWKLYYDKLGQTEIPTKMAASMNGSLDYGDNIFYIVVTSNDGVQVNVYELNVYRSYLVGVSYFDGEKLLYRDTAYTGYEYVADYVPDITGYTFHYWKNDATKYTSSVVWEPLYLYADKTANTYTVTYDVNDGNELSVTEKTLTYDSTYKLAKPTRTGYTFLGWSYNGTLLTDGTGNGLLPWNIPNNVTLTAKWQINEYTVTLNKDISSGGTVSGAGDYDYNRSVTITANTNNGYVFTGWYNGEKLLTNDLSYTFTMPAKNVTYTAKWSKVTLERNNSSAGSVSSLGKYMPGDEVTITASTNNGYVWLGWYDGDELLTNELSYTFTMPAENVTYTATWIAVPVTLERNNSSAGSVSSLGKYMPGDEVTITASTNNGYVWLGWYDGDELLTNELSYTFTMPAENVTYTAKWIAVPVTLERNNKSAGSISTLNGKYLLGQETTVTATTNNGYVFTGWYNGDELLTNELSYTFTMPAENVTYTAKWIAVPVTLERNNTSAGSVSSLGQYVLGDEITVTAYTKDCAYVFTGWYNGNELLTKELSYTFTMPMENVTYTAKWELVEGMEAFYFTSDATTCIITGLKKTGTELIIPDCVTSIGDRAFYDCNNLTSVVIGDSVETIGNNAFSDCVNLTSVVIGDSVETIGNNAFSNCDKLTSVVIPDSVTSIGILAFAYCDNLTSVEIGDSVKTIGSSAFKNCGNLTSVVIPDSVKTIGSSAFNYCKNLTSVVIGDSVETIDYGAFWGCDKLVEVYNKSSLTITAGSDDYGYVGCYAKEIYTETYTSKLSTTDDGYILYTDNEEVWLIGYTGSATDLTLPSNVTRIYEYAFYGCVNLTSLVIGDSVKTIGFDAFYDCDKLTSVVIPDSVTSIGSYAFYNCDKLTSITFNGSVDEWKAISKGGYWKNAVPATKVVCEDGDVAI